MKTLVFLVAAVCAVLSSPVPEKDKSEFFWMEVAPGIYRKENLTGIPQYTAVDSDLKIYYHSQSTTEEGVLVDLFDPASVTNAGFNNFKRTVFVIHGWLNGHDSAVNLEIRHAYLNKFDVNVFIADWSKIAYLDYVSAQFNVESLGQLLGEKLGLLVTDFGLNLANTILIGHSLGAHIAGVAGKVVNGQVDVVVGLDPAGPLFPMAITKNRIEKSSGKFVQIMHTDAGVLGLNEELGHADYWVNGGKHQPGCTLDVAGICSHNRAPTYHAESVETGFFIAKACTDWETYENGGCALGQVSYMGQDNIDKLASGNFYLETHSSSPFAKG